MATKSEIEELKLVRISKIRPVIKPNVPHKHAGYHELTFLFKGSGYHAIGDQVIEVRSLLIFYLKP